MTTDDNNSQSDSANSNPFAHHESSLQKVEKLQRVLLWSATWFVLLIAGIIFGTILMRGAPVLAKYGTSFLTNSPETLFVLKINEGTTLELPPKDYELVERSNPQLDFAGVTPLEVPRERVSFVVPPGHHRLSLGKLRDLEMATGKTFAFEKKHEAGEVTVAVDKEVVGLMDKGVFEEFTAGLEGMALRDQRPVTVTDQRIRFTLQERGQVEMPSTIAFKIKELNPEALKGVQEETHSYSAGGVLGPLAGTALLVIICMVVALFVGVSASVYLSEYAKQGSMMNSIRLAILNLAGVPSIVFGLFGLMLFVFLAPKVTNVVAVRDSVRVPLWPSFSEPPVRQQVEREIHIAKGTPIKEAVREANATRSKAVWNGRWYLSFEGWGTCMLAGGFTLAVMVLPVIITACEESLRAVPKGYREASLALGATKWESIRTAVLPYALPGILTASVLGITRVAGETAPIMFTAALAERSLLPWEGINRSGLGWLFDFLSQSVQALPYHIYTVAARIPQSEYTRPMQDGAVLVFMLFVMSFAGLSVWLRIRMRSKLKW
ncbi:PstA family ABC transporter permease [Roseibacillus ishigakijimensis]|uniref:ABC transporter permease subunit n=1 Tax=Roseibacillus ishigakijimensis TaxID=454146 RepID=A0A934RQF6_9BACT|nr:ABC transporter permease subunit [Roseibacillus ishigakijimensis]MBK1833982.1 ABC transporter permease subunit [Roseibacillus ishigakijimensis]